MARLSTHRSHLVEVHRGTARLANEPSVKAIRGWLLASLEQLAPGPSEVSVKIVSSREMTRLNAQYRHRHQPTNVLSFGSGLQQQDGTGRTFLGDLVLCNRVVQEESQHYGKPLESRYAHLLVHGLLHLMGQEHADPSSRAKMEAHEKQILASLGFHDDPYECLEVKQQPQMMR